MIGKFHLLIFITLYIEGCAYQQQGSNLKTNTFMQDDSIVKTEQEWKQVLTTEQFRILRLKETEAPFSGKYNSNKENGIYVCAACGNELFFSDDKFDSHCGWPSFADAIKNINIKTAADSSHGMNRTEIMCTKCGGHLGHVFNDGPTETKLRYCVNSVSIEFNPNYS